MDARGHSPNQFASDIAAVLAPVVEAQLIVATFDGWNGKSSFYLRLDATETMRQPAGEHQHTRLGFDGRFALPVIVE